jgi:hypothetical protein
MRQLPPETMTVDETSSRLAALEAAISTLRHDLRGILAPALLVADRLLAHADPKVVRAGETVVKSVRRAEARLQDTKAG